MALGSTVYKAGLNVSDMDRGYYCSHALTIARHPSETAERMMVRLLAFAFNASDFLSFGRGLSAEDEPDLWQKDLTGSISLWIEVGLPDERAVRKAASRAEKVIVYAYGGRAASVWWSQVEVKLSSIRNLEVYAIPAEASRTLGSVAERGMDLQCLIQEGSVWVSRGEESVSFSLERLR